MSEMFYTVLSPLERHRLFITILERSAIQNNHCIRWTGEFDKENYPQLRITFRGRRMRIRAHRLVYYLRVNFFLDPDLHVSHLCHNRYCININHLNYEGVGMNNERKTCLSERRCMGHRVGYPPCVLW
jgi:hypothetical protein